MACNTQHMTKDPNAKLPYGVDWSDWLEDGDAISESAWYVDGVLVEAETEPEAESGELVGYNAAFNTTIATIWLKNGVVRSYAVKVTNRIITSLDRGNDRTLYIMIAEQ